MGNYRYYIQFVGEDYEVFPLNTNKVKFETKLEEGQIFYRTKMLGKIKLYKQDFDFLLEIEKSVDRCETLLFKVERFCNNEISWEWMGTFSLNDGRWDLDNCTFEFEPQVKDKYSCIIDNKKKPVNILELTTTIPTEANLSPLGLQYSQICVGTISTGSKYLTNSGPRPAPTAIVPNLPTTGIPDSSLYINSCVIEEEGWQVYKIVYRDRTPGQNEWVCETTFFREVVETINQGGLPVMPLGTGWVNVDDGEVRGQATTIWARKPYGGTEDVYTIGYQFISTPNPDGQSTYAIQKVVTIWECKITHNQTKFIYDKGRSFPDSVWYLANKFCGVIPGVISDFFSKNSDGTHPENEEYEQAKANLNLLTISQKSDVKNPAVPAKQVAQPSSGGNPRGYYNQQPEPQTKTFEGATKGLLTWDQMEDILRNMFNVYWDIDDNTGAIRLEHLSYWSFPGDFDLTTDKYKKNLLGTNKYEYEKTAMPQTERFEFMEKSFDIDFLGAPISYNTICVNQDKESNEVTYQVTQITTDLNLIFSVKEAISSDGFVIFQNYIDVSDGNKLKVKSEEGFISGSPGVNKHLSWANLHYNYHRWGRVMSKGIMNNFETTFTSYRKSKRQDVIKISLCCDEFIIPQRKFITGLSNEGELRTMIHNIFDDTVELTIFHPNDGTGESSISRQFDDSFDLSFK